MSDGVTAQQAVLGGGDDGDGDPPTAPTGTTRATGGTGATATHGGDPGATGGTGGTGGTAILSALRATYARDAWEAAGFAAVTGVVATAAFVTVFVMLVAGFPLLVLALVGLPLIAGGMLAAHGVTRLDAWRFEAVLGRQLRLRPLPRREGSLPRRAISIGWSRLTSGKAWLEVAYALLVLPLIGWLGTYALFTLWGGGLAFLLFPGYGHALADGGQLLGLDLGYPVSVAVHVVVGVAALLAAPWLARGVVAAHLGLAQLLLSPPATEELERRVTDLTETRAGMVAAAAAERRRIERDLHDGAQQRLVAVAMTLGRAQSRFSSDPDAAHNLVAEAHAETKRALAELRDLARGIHPSVLTDRGLDAALSGLAARSPVQVTLDVAVEPRAPQDIEAVAYFFVAEALTNVARHAQATQVKIIARREGERLVVTVIDDGQGGADELAGSGISGLRDRARAVDGSFELDSPVGGPTTVKVGLPCVS